MKKTILLFVLSFILVFSNGISAHALVDAGQGSDEVFDNISWDEIVNGTYVKVTIPTTKLTLKVGQKGKFQVITSSSQVKLSWKSNNTKIAVVDASGNVTAKGVGTTEIFVTVGQSRYTCYVTVTAAKPKSVKINKSTFLYNGKVKQPTVKVCGVDGKALTTSDYTVKYSANSKNVGYYTVTVKMKRNYVGSYTFTYRIAPKATTIKQLSAGKKKFTVRWSPQKTQINGYQISYSLKKSMKDAKSLYVKKPSKSSVTISKLKAKKTYYVRIRTYKTVKKAGKTLKTYSEWSTIRKIKTK